MQKNLVIVESPAKAKTIEKFLGKDYKVMSSYGHIRDLKTKEFSIDIEHDYAPQYVIPADKKKLVSELKSEAKSAEQVWLASDEDREGEAISWHLYEVLGLKPENTKRIVFHEITKNAILHAIETPRDININLVNAQQARRVLDRIVGFELSPILWRKVKPALSAGRVQSVAVRLIVEREREINEFVSEAAFRVIANFILPDGTTVLKAELNRRLKDKKEVEAFLESCKNASFTIDDITTKPVKKSPAPPFTTSTLQQEAARKLGYSVSQTMMIAQRLYESGLITYMRTDSLRISEDAVQEAVQFIGERWGKQYLPSKPRHYKARANAQDGHEAIRPTSVALTPKDVESSLTKDQYKLYKLIWERFVACQMANCVLNTTQAVITAGDYIFKASGYNVAFDGYTVLYEEGRDVEEEKGKDLPKLEAGMSLKVRDLKGTQHFTQPPARFTEASLIKTLEENGIGRPSTYAPIITTIIDRGYVERDQKKLKPTLLGRAVDGLMLEQFPHIVDVDFSAQMEKNLDKVESGKADWRKTVDDFYQGFEASLEQAEKNMEGKKVKVPDEPSSEVCDLCGRPMVIKVGKYGKFLACSGFPECRGTKRLVKDTGGICPKCGKGRLLERKSSKGRIYYGCECYPDCDFMTWDMPVAIKCEKCGSTLFRKGGKLYCAKEGCGFEMPVPKKD